MCMKGKKGYIEMSAKHIKLNKSNVTYALTWTT